MKRMIALCLMIGMCLSVTAAFSGCDLFEEEHTHTYETVLSYDATHHWYACEDDSCTDTLQKAEHILVDGVCVVCGLKLGTVNNGNTGNENSTDQPTDDGTKVDPGNPDNPNNNVDNGDVNTVTCSYQVVSAPLDSGMVVMSSFRAGDYNYYYIDLGYAKNVPIWSGTALEYNRNQQSAPQLTFTKEMQNESSVEQSVSNTISKTVSHSLSEENTRKIGVEFGPDNLKFSKEFGYSRTWGNSTENANSTTSAYNKALTVSETYGTSASFYTGGCGYGYYRLSILATCDLYAFVRTNASNSQVYEITYTVCPREDAVLSVEYSENNDWVDPSAAKITINDDVIGRLPQPSTVFDKYVGNVYTTTAPATTAKDTDRIGVANHKGSTSFTISVPEELVKFQKLGFLYVEITATCNARLSYRSNHVSGGNLCIGHGRP